MAIDHVLAVIPVTNTNVSHAWYEKLFGVSATNVPMPGTLAEWRITGAGWVQVTLEPAKAGTALLNFAVDNLEAHLAQLDQRGITTNDIITANKGVQLAPLTDPDGNIITFIGNFREAYGD